MKPTTYVGPYGKRCEGCGVATGYPHLPRCGRDPAFTAALEEAEASARDQAADGRERVVNEETGGEKERRAARFDLLPWDALWEVAELYGAGAMKYDDHNWRKGYAWSLSIGAAGRHLAKIAAGEDIDEETSALLGKPVPHATALAFHALALLVFLREYPEGDDRCKTTDPPW